MDVLFFQFTLGFYLGGTVAYLFYLLSSHTRAAWIGRLFLSVGFCSHGLAFVLRYIEAGHTPVVNLHESLSLFACLIVGFFLLLRYRYQVEMLGAFVSPLALVLVIVAAALPKEIIPLPPALRSWWLPIHVTFAFLGDAIFEVNYRALTIGFPLLTIGIVTGAVWAEYAWGSYWSWDPKETWSLITWLLYAALLHQRLTIGWRGKKAAIMAIVGFGAVLFTFLGVNLLMAGLHTYAEWFR
jgi:ABC-type transport system involved in cytochrome c biogenesis permease subunit